MMHLCVLISTANSSGERPWLYYTLESAAGLVLVTHHAESNDLHWAHHSSRAGHPQAISGDARYLL